MTEKIKVEHQGFLGGGVWIIGWLFTLGFVQVTLVQGIIAILIWPYYLGRALAGF